MSAAPAPNDAHAFPTLAEMGVMRVHEISHYTLRENGAGEDVLKLHYRRPKGSILPETRKYTFGRLHRTVVADSGSGRLSAEREVSPRLIEALDELDRLVERQPAGARPSGAKERLLADLDAFRIEYAAKLPVEDAPTFSSRLYRLEERLQAL